MKLNKIILLALSVCFGFGNAFAGTHDIEFPETQANGKYIRIILANKHSRTFCLPAHTRVPYLDNRGLGKDFILGSNTNIIKQCTDSTCLNEKVIAADQYVITRNGNNLISNPSTYLLTTVDNNYGENCQDSFDEDCAGFVHCSYFKSSVEKTKTQKWIKISNKVGTYIACLTLNNGGASSMNKTVEKYHLQGKNVDTYEQCTDQSCKESKLIDTDAYFVSPGNDDTYTSQPLIRHITFDENYGENCSDMQE